MISIIISSYNEANYSRCEESIMKTIGVAFDIQRVLNKEGIPLTQIYEEVRKRAQYPYIVFMHEDVIMKKDNWGRILIDLMSKESNIGIVGIVGGKYKTTLPSGWTTWPVLAPFSRGHLYSGEGKNEEGYFDFDVCRESTKEPLLVEDVVVVDGLFMCVNAKVFETCHFEEDLLRGFHGYDTDFCLQAFLKGWRVVISREILLRHISTGNTDAQHEIANKVISQKYRKQLPIATSDLNMSKVDYLKWEIKVWSYHYYHGYIRPWLKKVKHRLF